MKTRIDGRQANDIRSIAVHYDAYGYADSSVLLEQGATKVLVAVSLQQGVPPFLKGQKTGWLNAEYAMLPHATQQRTTREATQFQRNGRSVEISRLIGRCLRVSIDIAAIGERTIVVDCDVLQADGGTRSACITAASIALKVAAIRWKEQRIFSVNVFKQQIAALSVGIVDGIAYADLSYAEDSRADADFNFVVSENNDLIEIQGTSEKAHVDWKMFACLQQQAVSGIEKLFQQLATCPLPAQPMRENNNDTNRSVDRQPMFSLANRLNPKSS